MIKYCPIRNNGNDYCMMDSCAWWNEDKGQCCVLAAAGKPSVETKPIYFDIGHPPLQDPDYIPPHNTNGTGNPYRIEGSSTCNTDDMIKKLNIKTNLFDGGPTEWI